MKVKVKQRKLEQNIFFQSSIFNSSEHSNTELATGERGLEMSFMPQGLQEKRRKTSHTIVLFPEILLIISPILEKDTTSPRKSAKQPGSQPASQPAKNRPGLGKSSNPIFSS